MGQRADALRGGRIDGECIAASAFAHNAQRIKPSVLMEIAHLERDDFRAAQAYLQAHRQNRAVAQLRDRLPWSLKDLESAAPVEAGEGRALLKGLLAEGFIERAGRERWEVTQAGRTVAAATAAKQITRATAENALQQFLGRVERVNRDPYFLGKVTKAILFGSMLKPEIDRLSDVDLAVELASKETDFDLARVKNYERVEELVLLGHQSRNFVEQEGCWYWEIFRFLKGQSRIIALADYAVEKALVLAVPHQFLVGQPEQTSVQSARFRCEL
jgi:predicted nucleotidyltransferase